MGRRVDRLITAAVESLRSVVAQHRVEFPQLGHVQSWTLCAILVHADVSVVVRNAGHCTSGLLKYHIYFLYYTFRGYHVSGALYFSQTCMIP